MIYKNILNAPHTLIAGTTGSGKSVLINGECIGEMPFNVSVVQIER